MMDNQARNSTMDASIIVCTYNRAESLAETLEALHKQKVPAGINWEVIVVDNNSSDHTQAIITEKQQHWPRLRHEFESQQGLSHARNKGIACARGEIILFTDDDVLPEPDWLTQVLEGLEKHQADACGGYIAPIWETPPPDWLTERFHGFLAIRMDREDDYPIETAGQSPYGANMAFKKNVFEKVGLFDTCRGRKGTTLASGEDGEMFERILNAGLKVIFLGNARVHHKVEAFRLKKSYFLRWRMQTSKNLAISQGVPGERRICNIPLYLLPQLARACLRALAAKVTKPKDEAFYQYMIVFHFIGLMAGLWQTKALTKPGPP